MSAPNYALQFAIQGFYDRGPHYALCQGARVQVFDWRHHELMWEGRVDDGAHPVPGEWVAIKLANGDRYTLMVWWDHPTTDRPPSLGPERESARRRWERTVDEARRQAA